MAPVLVDAVPVQQLEGPGPAPGGAVLQHIVLGGLQGHRFVPQGVVGVHERIGVQGDGGAGRREGLDHVALTAGIEHQEAVCAGQVGGEDGIAGRGGRVLQEGVTHDRRPHDARAAVCGDEVVDPHAHSGLVHPDLSDAPRGGEHQGGRAVHRLDPEQHHVFGGAVVHVPGLAVEPLPVATVVRDDERRAVVLDHLVGVWSADGGSHRVHEVREAADHDGLLGRYPRAFGDAAHLSVEAGRVCLVGREAGPGDVQDVATTDLTTRPELRAGKQDAFGGIGPDLLGVGRTMGVAHGRRAACKVQDPHRGSPHLVSLAHHQPTRKRFIRCSTTQQLFQSLLEP